MLHEKQADCGSEIGWLIYTYMYIYTYIRTYIHMRGDPRKNRIIFWTVGPLQYRLPPLGECSRNPSASVHQLAVLWEAAFGLSEFFEDSFNMFAHSMMGDLGAQLLTYHWVFGSFWAKPTWPLCPTLPISRDLTPSHFSLFPCFFGSPLC